MFGIYFLDAIYNLSIFIHCVYQIQRNKEEHEQLHKLQSLCSSPFPYHGNALFLQLSPFLSSHFKRFCSITRSRSILLYIYTALLSSNSAQFCTHTYLFSGIDTPPRVGFLGLGIMGTPMAQNLIKAGYVC
jgi:hypothetical protein